MRESLYEQLLPELEGLEYQREHAVEFKKPYNLYSIIAIVVGLLFLLMLWISEAFHIAWLIGVLAVMLIAVAILQSIGSRKIRSYKHDFHSQIIQAIVTSYDTSLKYSKARHISRAEFIQSDLFRDRPDRVEGSDYIEGFYKKIGIKASYLKAADIRRDDKGREHEDIIFSGLFMIADTYQDWMGSTYVLPDRSEKLLGSFGKWFQKKFGRATLVEMDDALFEREFVVYATHPEEARQILNSGMMENIHYIRKTLDKKIYLRFDRALLYIAISGLGKNLKIKSNEPATDPDQFERIHKEIHTWIDLLEELGLND